MIFTSSPGLGNERPTGSGPRRAVRRSWRAAPRSGRSENPFSSPSGRHRTCEDRAASPPGSTRAALAGPPRLHVHHDHPAARGADAHHLAHDAERVEEMMHGETRHHDVERTVGVRQSRDVALIPGDVGNAASRPRAAARGRAWPGSCRCRSRASPREQRRHDDAAAAGDVQMCIAGFGAAASTIIRRALASVDGRAVLNGVACRVN